MLPTFLNAFGGISNCNKQLESKSSNCLVSRVGLQVAEGLNLEALHFYTKDNEF